MFPISLGRRHLICFKFKPLVMALPCPNRFQAKAPKPLVGSVIPGAIIRDEAGKDGDFMGYLADVTIKKQGYDDQETVTTSSVIQVFRPVLPNHLPLLPLLGSGEPHPPMMNGRTPGLAEVSPPGPTESS